MADSGFAIHYMVGNLGRLAVRRLSDDTSALIYPEVSDCIRNAIDMTSLHTQSEITEHSKEIGLWF